MLAKLDDNLVRFKTDVDFGPISHTPDSESGTSSYHRPFIRLVTNRASSNTPLMKISLLFKEGVWYFYHRD